MKVGECYFFCVDLQAVRNHVSEIGGKAEVLPVSRGLVFRLGQLWPAAVATCYRWKPAPRIHA